MLRLSGELVRIGEHVRERLACKPIEFFVRREVFPQYACRPCELAVAEPVPPAVLDRRQADASRLAQVTVAKYLDHLPLHRQEGIYARSGVDLARSTLAEWIVAVGVALQPLVRTLKEQCVHRQAARDSRDCRLGPVLQPPAPASGARDEDPR